MDKSYLTAITRKKPSLPMRYLFKQSLLKGKCLDYGCGKGFDADYYAMDKYDPYHHNVEIKGNYDTITCNYVLNTIPAIDSIKTISTIRGLLNDGGIAYITVRRDVDKRHITKRGTLQRPIYLPLEIVKETSGYCIYKIVN